MANLGLNSVDQFYQATIGFEPMHSGFADRRVNQLRHVAMGAFTLPKF